MIVVLGLAGWTGYLSRKYPTASPIRTTAYLIQQVGHPHAHMQQQVIGFLPYWQQDGSAYVALNLLSEVVYFALTADDQGRILTEKDGKAEPGWRAWTSSAVRDQIARTQISGAKVVLSVAQQDGVQLGAFLDDAGAQQRLVSTLASEMADNHLDGLNLDFEFSGESTPAHRQVFTDFGRALVAAVHSRAPGTEVSIDLPPTSAGKPGLYDVPALAQIFDRLIVMSYDYYTPGSDVAGPVAPMSGYAEKQYFFDVTTTYDEYSQAAPADKLIMGVPYYGYDWPVDDNSKPLPLVLPQDDANGYAEVVSYRRMKAEPNFSGPNCHWDEAAQETWCEYADPNNNVQRRAWVEDDRSIAVKFEFARERQFGGVALWTLGYIGPDSQPWDLLRREFTTSP
jgi:spore germination protein YaaH